MRKRNTARNMLVVVQRSEVHDLVTRDMLVRMKVKKASMGSVRC